MKKAYESVDEFRKDLAEYALRHNFATRYINSDSTKYVYGCRTKSCFFRAKLYKRLNGMWCLTTFREDHSCPIGGTLDHGPATSSIVSEKIQGMVDDNPSTLVKDISSFVRREFGETISYSTAWRAREKSRQAKSQERKEEFGHLTNFVTVLLSYHPDSVCDVALEDDHFQRIFVCPSPLIEAFSHSLGVIALDGAHLKSGFGGILLTASMFDCNMKIMLLAFAVVESECLASWMWFCDHLNVAANRSQISISVVVSDRDKGLKEAVATVFPSAGHRFCLRHLAANMRNKFGGKQAVERALYSLASQHSEDAFISLFDKLPGEVKTFLGRIEANSWAFFATKKPAFGLRTSNAAESMNAALCSIRELPPLSICLEIYKHTMTLMAKRRLTSFESFSEFAKKTLGECCQRGRRYNVSLASDTMGLVAVNNREYRVNLETSTCSCLQYQDLLIPCDHACAVCLSVNKSPQELIGNVYSADNYAAFYAPILQPITRDEVLGLGRKEIFPPVVRRQRGRPKKQRIPSQGENVGSTRCSNCGNSGHNRRSCNGYMGA